MFLKAYATSGMVANTPYAIQWGGSGYTATILAASIYGYVGVPEGSNAVASGCEGWVQIRGYVEGVQCGAADVLDVVLLVNHVFRGGPAPEYPSEQ